MFVCLLPYQSQLVQRATQFRAVQRRLLTKFKDKTPTPLTNLDNLLEGTYKQILHITDLINENIKVRTHHMTIDTSHHGVISPNHHLLADWWATQCYKLCYKTKTPLVY